MAKMKKPTLKKSSIGENEGPTLKKKTTEVEKETPKTKPKVPKKIPVDIMKRENRGNPLDTLSKIPPFKPKTKVFKIRLNSEQKEREAKLEKEWRNLSMKEKRNKLLPRHVRQLQILGVPMAIKKGE